MVIITKGIAWLPIIFLLMIQCLGLVNCFAPSNEFAKNREENEVTIRDLNTALLPVCGSDDAVCAMLQVNALGVNHEPLCTCSQPHLPCRLLWDTEDGHSITQGSDQYKFCGSAPALEQCSLGSTKPAYITRSVFSSETSALKSQTDRLECICNPGFIYVLKDSDMSSQGGLDIMEYSYTCEPLSLCSEDEICRRISVSSTSFMVTDKCKCHRSSSCPSVGSRRMTRVPLGRGEMQLLRCQ